jgi:hypothetical protein
MAVEVASGPDRLLVLSDTILHPIHVEHPGWKTVYALLPDQAIATRHRLLRRAAEQRVLVAAFDLPFPGIGRIATTQLRRDLGKRRVSCHQGHGVRAQGLGSPTSPGVWGGRGHPRRRPAGSTRPRRTKPSRIRRTPPRSPQNASIHE